MTSQEKGEKIDDKVGPRRLKYKPTWRLADKKRQKSGINRDLLRTHIFSRTPKPLTFSKNRLRVAKNRSNIIPVAKKFPKKRLFFFKNFAYVQKNCFAYMHILSFCFKNAQIPEFFLKFFYRSLYNTYLKGFNFFSANFNNNERFGGSRSRFFERNNGLGDIGNWGSSRRELDLLRTHIFPRTRELPQFPISPKPLFLSKNRLRNPPKRSYTLQFAENFFRKNDIFFLIFVYVQLFFFFAYVQLFFFAFFFKFVLTKPFKYVLLRNSYKKFQQIFSKVFEKKSCFFGIFFATGLVFERFLAPEVGFSKKLTGPVKPTRFVGPGFISMELPGIDIETAVLLLCKFL
ncbi:hypothetical protein LXL04_014958 [Taraxacum kok-saghyz]